MRSYIKLDASFFRHPKAVAAGRDARDLFIAGLCYSGDLLTDGFVPTGSVPLLAAECGVKNHRAAVESLLAVGLWEVDMGGYRAHDYDEYNTGSEEVRAKRAAARERMQRLRSQDVRANNERTSQDVREQEKEKEKEPPSNPPAGDTKPTRLRSVKTPVPDELVGEIPSETWRDIGAEQRLTEDQLRFETALMIDHYRAKGERRTDWVATWRNWMRSDYRQSKPGLSLVKLDPNSPEVLEQRSRDAMARLV